MEDLSYETLPVLHAENDRHIDVKQNNRYIMQNSRHGAQSFRDTTQHAKTHNNTESQDIFIKLDLSNQKSCVIEIESKNCILEEESKDCIIEIECNDSKKNILDSKENISETVVQDVIKDDLPENQPLTQENETREKTQPTSLLREFGKINSFDSVSLNEPCCRICQCDTTEDKLISPCDCCGSVKWVHQSCLVQWMKSSFKESCELCMKDINIIKRRKSFSKWQLPTQRPTPVLWVLVFISAIALNLASVVKDASRRCSSTPCLVFYAVGCIGVILGTLFVVYWSKRARNFVNRWMEQNEEWVVLIDDEKKNKREVTKVSSENT